MIRTLVIAMALLCWTASSAQHGHGPAWEKVYSDLESSGILVGIHSPSCTAFVNKGRWEGLSIEDRETFSNWFAVWMYDDNMMHGVASENLFWKYCYVEESSGSGRTLATWTEAIGMEVYVYSFWTGNLEGTTKWKRFDDGTVRQVNW